jgi:hypothetical protein
MVQAELLGEEVGCRAAVCVPEGVGIDALEIEASEFVAAVQQNPDQHCEEAMRLVTLEISGMSELSAAVGAVHRRSP